MRMCWSSMHTQGSFTVLLDPAQPPAQRALREECSPGHCQLHNIRAPLWASGYFFYYISWQAVRVFTPPAMSLRTPCPVAAVQHASCSTISAAFALVPALNWELRPPGAASVCAITCA